ncbi:MAG TPA: prolipoprotein diacylglyceryl transferase [Mycobacteriales bacterium]|nr:prolipoprotein diacylglyceryl transferase [Mycobacteriales bacterium]
MLPVYIPSPSRGVWHVAGFPIRAYALCIIAGVVAAVIIGDRRLVARGGRKGVVGDIAVWAVPAGLIGARLYHLATSSNLYWGGPGRSGTIGALKIWDGGLGIWGAVLGGALGAWIGCRRNNVSFAVFADALAPALPVAQAIGRWGNWFNQELYGRATHLPWALHITHPSDGGTVGYYHPTFLYESLWDIGVAVVVVLLDRRRHFDKGRAFALYVMLYTVGRGWIEALRIDTARHFLGLRLNDWTSIVVFVAAAAYFVVAGRKTETADPTTSERPTLDGVVDA